jgi:2-methylcitrate dehydratase
MDARTAKLDALNLIVDPRVLDRAPAIPPGIFGD